MKYLRTKYGHEFHYGVWTVVWWEDLELSDVDAAAVQASADYWRVKLYVSDTPTPGGPDVLAPKPVTVPELADPDSQAAAALRTAGFATSSDVATAKTQAVGQAVDQAATYTDDQVAAIPPPPAVKPVPAATITYHRNTSPAYDYEVIRVRGGEPLPRIVENLYAYDYEQTWTPGTPFAPIREPLTGFYARHGHDILTDSGALTGATDGDPIVGPSIKDGVAYSDFFPANGQQGTDAIGFRADGTAQLYSIRWGDTVAGMLADGVVDAFSFGPALVVDGVAQNLEGNAQWGSFNTEDSARTQLGVTLEGDVVIVLVHGKSGEYGIRGNECVNVMVRHGCHQAIMLDGGGSTSMLVNGEHAHISSDVSGYRPAQSCIGIRARIAQVDTGWVPVPYAAGFTYGADSWRQLAVRRIGERVMMRGRAVKASGQILSGAWTTVATLPREFIPKSGATAAASGASGSASAQVSVLANDRAIQVQPNVSTGNVDFGAISYLVL